MQTVPIPQVQPTVFALSVILVDSKQTRMTLIVVLERLVFAFSKVEY